MKNSRTYWPPYNSFSFCTELSEVKFEAESKIEIIGKNSFELTSIESIILPSSVTTIQSNAFVDCSYLSEIKFEENSKLKTIGQCAFNNTQINKILIPKSVTAIQENAFSYCNNLSSIEFEKDSMINSLDESFNYTILRSICFPSRISYFEFKFVNDCDELNSIEFLASFVLFNCANEIDKPLIISFPNVFKINFYDIFNEKNGYVIFVNSGATVIYHMNIEI